MNFTLFIPSNTFLNKKYSSCFFDSIDKGLAIQIVEKSMMNRRIDKKILQSTIYAKYPTISKSTFLNIKNICNETLIDCDNKILHFNHPAINGIIHVISDLLLPN